MMAGGVFMQSYEAVLADAAQLPVPDRIQLIDAIWDTLPAEAMPPLSQEWIAEIQRRSMEYDAGHVKTVPWQQVKADALRRAGVNVFNAD
jgi:putative addiction module component (TIGR02574 family)